MKEISNKINTIHGLAYKAPSPIIIKFPKEFRKNWIKSLDVRFLLILLVISIFSFSMTLYFSNFQIYSLDTMLQSNLHDKYAQLLVRDEIPDEFFADLETKDTYLFGIDDEAEIERVEEVVATSVSSDYNRNVANVNRTQTVAYASGKTTSKTDVSSAVSSSGILGYITMNSRLTENPVGEIMDIERTSSIATLSDIEKLKTHHPQVNYAMVENYELRGNKIDKIAVAEVFNSMSQQEEAKVNLVTKNVEIEELTTTDLAKRHHKSGNGITRTSEEITRVMMMHNRSIQDCYKQALKRDSQLKGKIVIRFSVTPEGRVNVVNIISSTIDDDRIKQCILRRVQRWNDFGECDPALGNLNYRQTYVFGY